MKPDTAKLLCIILSGFFIFLSGLGIYIGLRERNNYLLAIEKTQQEVTKISKQLSENLNNYRELARFLGWSSPAGEINYEMLKSDLEKYTKLINEEIGQPKYDNTTNLLSVKSGIEDLEKLADDVEANIAKVKSEIDKIIKGEGGAGAKEKGIQYYTGQVSKVDDKLEEIKGAFEKSLEEFNRESNEQLKNLATVLTNYINELQKCVRTLKDEELELEKNIYLYDLIKTAYSAIIKREDKTYVVPRELEEKEKQYVIYLKKILRLREKQRLLNTQIEKLEKKISKATLKKKVVAKIIAVDKDGIFAWINVGRFNGLFKDTLFDIYGKEKGGRLVYKGQAYIVQMDDVKSKIQILYPGKVIFKDGSFIDGTIVYKVNSVLVNTLDGAQQEIRRNEIKNIEFNEITNPVKIGDILFAKTFDPETPKIICFAGNLELKYKTFEAKKVFENYNFVIKEKPDIDVDMLIIGKGYQKDENYKLARELNIKIMREKDFYELLDIYY